ncbi:MAG: hypothetical protein C0503_02820 [Gemmatimonas sp.]|nr:hypothetical protein [Gemmatimonas sp.]
MSFWQSGESLEDELRSGRFVHGSTMTEAERERIEREDQREVRSHRRIRGAVGTILLAFLLVQIVIPYATAWWIGKKLGESAAEMFGLPGK